MTRLRSLTNDEIAGRLLDMLADGRERTSGEMAAALVRRGYGVSARRAGRILASLGDVRSSKLECMPGNIVAYRLELTTSPGWSG